MTIFTLMTALPPTKGHRAMIEFAARWGGSTGEDVEVILHSQPDEPMVEERAMALVEACRRINMSNLYPRSTVRVLHFHQSTVQNPDTPGFREFWRDTMWSLGFQKGDTLVCAESYGKWLAEICGGKFVPYDPKRETVDTKATRIRERGGLKKHFSSLMPEFQPFMRTTITVFGAESVGKTTFSKELAALSDSYWLHEYARPMLEMTSPELDREVMLNIARGQAVMQDMMEVRTDCPFIIQDTDLYSTVGYWQLPAWNDKFGVVPLKLIQDASSRKSDLYIILKSNIPFESDPLRYGGDVRESEDQYWIDLAEANGLNYVVLDESGRKERRASGMKLLEDLLQMKQDMITYDRGGF